MYTHVLMIYSRVFVSNKWRIVGGTATLCNTLQHTTTHCNALQHSATKCNKGNTPAYATRACNLKEWAASLRCLRVSHDDISTLCVAVCCSVLQCVTVYHYSRISVYFAIITISTRRATWLTHVCDITHSYVRHDSFTMLRNSVTCVTWLIHMRDMTPPYAWHVSFIWVTWVIHKCDMAHLSMRHDSFVCVTWLIHMRDMTHSYVWHDSSMRVTWLIQMCDMTPSDVWHDLFIFVT